MPNISPCTQGSPVSLDTRPYLINSSIRELGIPVVLQLRIACGLDFASCIVRCSDARDLQLERGPWEPGWWTLLAGAHVSWESCTRTVVCLRAWVFKALQKKLLSSIYKIFLPSEFIFKPLSTVFHDGTEETFWKTSHKRASEELQTDFEAKSYGIHLHWGRSYRCGGNWILGLLYDRSYSFTKLDLLC